MAKLQTSPGNALSPSRLCPPHLRTSFPYRYRTLKGFAFSSSLHASYAISVRRASVLPAASSRFHLAMDTLAVRLTIPPVGFVGDFHSLVRAPCRAHKGESGQLTLAAFVFGDGAGNSRRRWVKVRCLTNRWYIGGITSERRIIDLAVNVGK